MPSVSTSVRTTINAFEPDAVLSQQKFVEMHSFIVDTSVFFLGTRQSESRISVFFNQDKQEIRQTTMKYNLITDIVTSEIYANCELSLR